jgi:hypothetical protein
LSEEEAGRLVRQGFVCGLCVREKEAGVVMRGELDNKAQSDLLEELRKFFVLRDLVKSSVGLELNSV